MSCFIVLPLLSNPLSTHMKLRMRVYLSKKMYLYRPEQAPCTSQNLRVQRSSFLGLAIVCAKPRDAVLCVSPRWLYGTITCTDMYWSKLRDVFHKFWYLSLWIGDTESQVPEEAFCLLNTWIFMLRLAFIRVKCMYISWLLIVRMLQKNRFVTSKEVKQLWAKDHAKKAHPLCLSRTITIWKQPCAQPSLLRSFARLAVARTRSQFCPHTTPSPFISRPQQDHAFGLCYRNTAIPFLL